MFLYAVAPLLKDDHAHAWQYRAPNRAEREITGDPGHYFVSIKQNSLDDPAPNSARAIHWVGSKTEAELLAADLTRKFPGNTYVVLTVGSIYQAQVRDIEVKRHVEGEGILPV